MRMGRRRFLTAAGAAAACAVTQRARSEEEATADLARRIDRAAAEPILQLSGINVGKITSLELLRNDRVFLVRVRTSDGAEGLAVPNADRLIDCYPIFLNRIAPFFIGKNPLDLENLLWEVYRHSSNYKLQGVALWVCMAAAEFAILDLLGKLSAQSIGQMLGGVQRQKIAVYRASGNRGNAPEAEIEYLQQLVEETGAKAVKFRLGGRMSRNQDSLPGRSEKLIPLVRETFGDQMTLYADANSSYDASKAIRIGCLMQYHKYGFFEEPCPFDHHEETKLVADALEMPVAGGEQDGSMWRFRWMILNRGVDIVQPDLHYFGGFLRCMRVARMAEVVGMPCTLHMSGSGLGYLDVLHFASSAPIPGPYQEFKGESKLPIECSTSSLRCEQGHVNVPTGPGFGVTIDPKFVAQATPVSGL